MKRGKYICKTLKSIRQQIADANGIKYFPTKCHHKGDCPGTCPKCEQELRFIEQQIDIRKMMGKAAVVAGLGIGVSAFTACGNGKGEPEIQNENRPSTSVTEQKTINKTDSSDNNCNQEKPSANSKTKRNITTTGETVDDTTNTKYFVGEIVEQMPMFPGGPVALKQFIVDNLKYPEEAEEDSVQGRVIVSFVVEDDGSITEVKVAKSVDPRLDKEAVEVVSKMPKWTPGQSNGKNVRVNYQIPINFKLHK